MCKAKKPVPFPRPKKQPTGEPATHKHNTFEDMHGPHTHINLIRTLDMAKSIDHRQPSSTGGP